MTSDAHDEKIAVAPVVSSKTAMRRLREYLGDPLPEDEARLWAEMSFEQRAKAMQRMTTLTRWNLGEAPQHANMAAWNAGLKSVSRFYEMAKAWKKAPSLRVIGMLATAPRKRMNRNEDVLGEKAVEVIDANPDSSVRQLAIALGDAAELADKTPSYNTLRRFIEEELRRRSAKARPGEDVMFDCCACSMHRMDGSEYTLFAVLDRQSQLILGASLGDAHDSRGGYRKAAASALEKLESPPLAGAAWVERTARFELVVGADAGRWTDIRSELAQAGVRAPIETSTRPRRFGRYLRQISGPRLGRIVLSPTKTDLPVDGEGSVVAPTVDDVTRLWLEIDAHNAERLAGLDRDPDAGPPADLKAILRHLASG